MPFDGNGNYVPPSSSWNPAVSATDILPTDWNTLLDDVSTALSTCVTTDGQSTATAEVPFDQGISAPHVLFPAVQVPSSDPNALDDYAEGTFTPTDQSGAGLVFASAKGTYVKIGRLCWVALNVTYPVTADTTQMAISLPFTADATQSDNMQGLYSGATNSGRTDRYVIIRSTSTVQARTTSNAAVNNVSYSGSSIVLTGTYFTDA